MRLVLLGAPGAGKGTQAVSLSEAFGLVHVASGDLFREALREGTDLGIQAKSYMDRGQLVPDEVTIMMILGRIARPDCEKGFILDGFPRTLEQAQALEEALKKEAKAIDKVLYIKVSVEELVKRLSGRCVCRVCQMPYHNTYCAPEANGICDRCGGQLFQRPDDNDETVKERVKVYFSNTAPLIDYYTKAGKLQEVNGGQEVEIVARELVAATT